MNFLDTLNASLKTATLANGIRVLFRRTLPSGLVSVRAWVKTGSIHEENFLGGGLSHFLEHMVFKGTEKFSCEEISRRVQAVGGALNAYTTFSRTVFYADVPVEAAETAFDVLSQMTLFPTLDADAAALEKNVVLREIAMGEDDPDSRLADAMFAEAFRVHPYRFPVIGHRNIFQEMGVEELRLYLKKRYTPQNIAVVVAGDIDAERVFALAEKYFANAPVRATADVFIPDEPPQFAPREITLRGDVNVLRGSMVWKIPDAAHDDAPALFALASALGKGDSSILWRELHERRGIVHDVNVSAWMPSNGGLFWIDYDADLGARAKIEDALLATVAETARSGVDFSLLKKSVRGAFVNLVNSFATASAAAGRLGLECVERGGPAETKKFFEKLETLTPDDVRRVAEKYLGEEKRTTSAFEQKLPCAKTSAKKCEAKTVAPAKTQTLPSFEEARLACGIRVLLRVGTAFPKVHLRATMLGGGEFESERTKGATALLSTLMTLDAGTRSAAEIAEEIESVGGVFEEISGNNSFSLFAETLSGDAPIACKILADALAAPRFSEEIFLRERATQLASVRSENDEIEAFAENALRREFFGKHALGVHNYGTEKSLGALALSDISALHARLVVPSNIVIAAAGDFDREKLIAELEENFAPERFADAPKTPEDFFSEFKKHVPEEARRKEIASPAAAEQAIVQLAFPDVGACDERADAGTVLAGMLNGLSSRLFFEVREKRGLAYFVGARRISSPTAGMFFLRAGTEKEKTEAVLDEMRKELERLRAGKFSAEELDGAKARALVARRSARQRLSACCARAALDALFRMSDKTDAEKDAHIRAVSAADVASFASEILSPKNELEFVVK